MSKVEIPQNSDGELDPIEMVALFRAGKITREEIGEGNLHVLEYWLGQTLPPNLDSAFSKQVRLREEQIRAGVNSSLSSETKTNNPTLVIDSVIDPDRRLYKLGSDLDSPYTRHRKTAITEDILHKKNELRNIIGIPILKANDPLFGDGFYRYLVKRVCKQDIFNIFFEYYGVIATVPKELKVRIGQVSILIDRLLYSSLDRRQQFREFNHFLEEYRRVWNISEERFISSGLDRHQQSS